MSTNRKSPVAGSGKAPDDDEYYDDYEDETGAEKSQRQGGKLSGSAAGCGCWSSWGLSSRCSLLLDLDQKIRSRIDGKSGSCRPRLMAGWSTLSRTSDQQKRDYVVSPGVSAMARAPANIPCRLNSIEMIVSFDFPDSKEGAGARASYLRRRPSW